MEKRVERRQEGVRVAGVSIIEVQARRMSR